MVVNWSFERGFESIKAFEENSILEKINNRVDCF
jgi:hypothetical protein